MATLKPRCEVLNMFLKAVMTAAGIILTLAVHDDPTYFPTKVQSHLQRVLRLISSKFWINSDNASEKEFGGAKGQRPRQRQISKGKGKGSNKHSAFTWCRECQFVDVYRPGCQINKWRVVMNHQNHKFPQIRIYFGSLFCCTLSGAQYNLDLLESCREGFEDLTKSSWPGIESEPPLPLGAGASQVSCSLMGIWYNQWGYANDNIPDDHNSRWSQFQILLRLFSTLQIWRMPCLPMGNRMDQAMSAASPSSHVTWCSTLTPVSQTQCFLSWFQTVIFDNTPE